MARLGAVPVPTPGGEIAGDQQSSGGAVARPGAVPGRPCPFRAGRTPGEQQSGGGAAARPGLFLGICAHSGRGDRRGSSRAAAELRPAMGPFLGLCARSGRGDRRGPAKQRQSCRPPCGPFLWGLFDAGVSRGSARPRGFLPCPGPYAIGSVFPCGIFPGRGCTFSPWGKNLTRRGACGIFCEGQNFFDMGGGCKESLTQARAGLCAQASAAF